MYLSEGDDVVLVGRDLQRLESAIPKDFQAKGKALYLAKDVSTVCTLPQPCTHVLCQTATSSSRLANSVQNPSMKIPVAYSWRAAEE